MTFPTRTFWLAGSILLSLSGACGRAVDPADLVLENGKIVTLDESLGSVQALAVRGDRIVAAGDSMEIRKLVGPATRVIDLNGRLATPGFIEGHGHLMALGEKLTILPLQEASSWQEIVSRVEEAVGRTPPGEWIRGRGWHQDEWETPPQPQVEGLPVHTGLSAVSPDHPVLLTHRSGHASFVNARALALAGITDRTPDPEGGTIVRNRHGKATGMLRERAQLLVRQVFAEHEGKQDPAAGDELQRRRISLALQNCLSNGITTFQDAGSTFQTVEVFKRLADAGELPVRLWVMLSEGNTSLQDRIASYRQVDSPGNRLTVRAIKRGIDGALGTHGAWLMQPYTDLPSTSGLRTADLEDLRETARIALANGFQLCVHAIGDRANFEVLNLFQEMLARHPDGRSLRWRIEHAQHLQVSDIPRFARLGVIASMQAVHCTSDGSWVPDRLGEKRTREGAYAWRSLIDAGAVVTNGTDAPVEDISPIQSFYASVSRRLPDGSVFVPEQRMTRMEALRSYTIQNAYAAFEEDLKGSLTPGKLADIVVLDRNILTLPEEAIPGARVDLTIVGGRVEFSRH